MNFKKCQEHHSGKPANTQRVILAASKILLLKSISKILSVTDLLFFYRFHIILHMLVIDLEIEFLSGAEEITNQSINCKM